MELAAGERLGTYEVIALLGAGGMGQVYRARDLKLNREVAIKILPAAVAGDRDRLLRFEREARTLAALNHPNIAQIHGLIDKPAAIVMELVPGDELSRRIAAGPMPPGDLVALALQMAQALEASHELGIVHRDLKPANIRVRPDGVVKVLDFGLAKIVGEPDTSGTTLADSPTRLSPAVTHHGVILGTARYMAPEQARGRPIDKRADIWAFGVVLFEMLAGQPPFGGDGVTETIARVIEREPDWSLLPPGTPQYLCDLIRRCLVKDPQRRLRDIGDARIALESGPAAGSTIVTTPERSRTAQLRPFLPGLLAGLGVLVAGLAAFQIFNGAASDVQPAALRQLRVPTIVANVPAGSDFSAIVSPDGQKIATFTDAGISVRWLSDGRTSELAKSDDVRQVFWSPDSRWVGFATMSEIAKVSIDGGAPFVLVSLAGIPGPFNVQGGNVAWFAGDRLVFTTGFSGLMEVRPPSTTPAEIVPLDSGTMTFRGAFPLPDGRVLTSVHDDDAAGRFEVVDGRDRREVFRDAGADLGMPVYSSTGHILFSKAGQNAGVWSLPFDLSATKATGPPFLVIAGTLRPSVSADGQLLIGSPPSPPAIGRLTIIRRDGSIERQLSPDFTERLQHPAWAPDGRHIVVPLAGSPGLPTSTLFSLSDDGRRATQMTAGVDVAAGRFFPDGQRLLVETGGAHCLGAGCYSTGWKTLKDHRIEPIVQGMGGDLSPDAKTLVYAARVKGVEWDLFAMPVDRSGPPIPFQGGTGWQFGPRFSPDGQWVAYVSTESGRPEIWVAQFPAGGKWRVSAASGYWPRWDGDGRVLLYARGTTIAHVSFTPGTPPAFGTPLEMLPRGTLMQTPVLRIPSAFDVTPDGHRFVVIKDPQVSAPVTVELLQRWVK
jgi:dipeptidyl aminopeptidase/acylaminoacyl peptidase